MHLAAQIGAYGAVILGTAILFLFCLACRQPAMDYVCGIASCPECSGRKATGPTAECTPEAPTLPRALIVHLAVSDRMDVRDRATPAELERFREGLRKIRDREAAEKLIREVGGC